MERNFYNEEFEQFLKQKSDQHKMYPSDRVWNNVYNSLHTTRRWLGLGFLLLLITGTTLVSRELFLAKYNQVTQKVNQSMPVPNTPVTLTAGIGENTDIATFIPAIKHRAGYSIAKPKQELQITGNDIPVINMDPGVMSSSELVADNNKNEIAQGTEGSFVIENNLIPSTVAKPATHAFNTPRIKPRTFAVDNNKIDENKDNNLIKNNYIGNIGAYKPSNWSFQLYASPIVSYRRLADLSGSRKYAPVTANYSGDINDLVHHKPALGFELGTKIQYRISNNLFVYAGAQLNYSRYYIDAYRFHPDLANASALSNSRMADMPDSLADYTSARSFTGYTPEQLQNQYFQVSVPIGAELKLLGNNRLQLSIAGSLQPTYLISSTSYLISSDYKNYIQNADLSRKFNLHTNVEAFVSYKLGGLKWQLGPQFRYQVFSSYSSQYPIHEYLTEFGIKLGITKTIW